MLQTEPWRRAPRLLLRHRAVLAAIAGTCALLAIAAASGPLFLSSAGAAALQRRVAEQCPEADRPALRASAGDARGATRAMTAAGLPAPYGVVVDGISAPFGSSSTPTGLTLYGRADVFDHVRKVGGGGEGLWVSDLDAERYRVKVGDRVTVGSLSIPIAGRYQDLAGPGLGLRTLPPYWCTWTQAIVPTLDNRPPPFVIADGPTMARIVAASQQEEDPRFAAAIDSTWYSPVDTTRLTLTEADGVLAGEQRLKAAVGRTAPNGLGADLASARATRDGIAGAIIPVALAGVLVAVLLVGAAASFWVDQRRAELRLLGARGIGPPALAGKAVLELGLPALAGTAVGWGAAIVLVRTAGPASELEPGAPWQALAAVLPALAAALLALAAVAAGRTAERSRHRRLPPVPWELGLLALAGWAYAGLDRVSAGVVADRLVVRVDPRLVTFGLLGTAGAVLLLARLLTALLPWLRRRTATAPTPVHLAVRRLAGLRTATAAVLVAMAVPIAILGYAGAVTRSTDATVAAKARTYAGTEHAIVLNAAPAETIPVGGTGTQVSVIRDVRTVAGSETEVLGVDPATFARFAYADRRVFGADVPELVRRLEAPGLPALAIGCPECGPRVRMTLGRSELTATVVGTARLFPGLRVRGAALLVVPRAALADIDRYSNRIEEIWTTTALLPSALDTVTRAGRPPLREVSPNQFLGSTQLLPVTWTFGYLQALAGLIGLIGMAGLFLFLAARQRSTLVSYVLLRRIGLTRRAHLGSLAGELGGVLALGWLLGVGCAVGFAAAVRGLLDVNPVYPPGGLLVLPVTLLAIGIGVLLVVAAAGALGTQRVADAAEPATLLRGADS